MGTAVMEKPEASRETEDSSYTIDDVFTPFTKKVMESCATKLTHSPHFQSHEKDDLIQELGFALWQSMETFDRRVAHFNSFATTVISRSAKTMLRQRRRLKRKCDRHIKSMDDLVQSGDYESVHHRSVAESDAARRLQVKQRVESDAVNMREDIETILQTLPATLAETAHALMQHPLSAAAKHLQISRATLHRRIDLLREHFASALFNDYL